MIKKKRPVRKWEASEILALLAARHSSDVFVPECKDGPTWGGEHLRMDAWAMRRSWAKPCVWAYEIKVNRSDFLGDDKWHGALCCCNAFFFVCPPGLIQADELPKEVGLLWASVSGARLMTKRKAHFRKMDSIPDSLCRYILMSRATIHSSLYARAMFGEKDNIGYWRRWLAEKESSRSMGREVGRRLYEKYERDVIDVRQKQAVLEAEIEGLRSFRELAKRMKLDSWDMKDKDRIKHKIEKLRDILPDGLLWQVRNCAERLAELVKDMESARNAGLGDA